MANLHSIRNLEMKILLSASTVITFLFSPESSYSSVAEVILDSESCLGESSYGNRAFAQLESRL